MGDSDWIWMPHAAHLCVSATCQFRLATYVNGVIVSTVGEYEPSGQRTRQWETIGLDRLYETMVFRAVPSGAECDVCPYTMTGGEIDFAGYNTAQDAYAGHLALCQKWAQADANHPPIRRQ